MKPSPVHCIGRSALMILAILFAGPMQAQAGPPSFDCGNANADDEIAICSSTELSELDNLMDAGFQFLRLRYGKTQANQVARPLLRLRQACGADADCIMKRQVDAIKTYQQLGAPIRLPDWVSASAPADNAADGMPTIVGACATSTIDMIGGRLQGDDNFESGTYVGFANGGGQTSYDKVWGIIRSKIGDPVKICLISIPKSCPPADERGKVYATTNLRTGESWELSDSQHECGGA